MATARTIDDRASPGRPARLRRAIAAVYRGRGPAYLALAALASLAAMLAGGLIRGPAASATFRPAFERDYQSFVEERRIRIVPFHEFPPALKELVVASEDRRFFVHSGIDPVGIARAALVNLRRARLLQGGSTITQQLAKTIRLRDSTRFVRKFQEMRVARRIEAVYPKERILEMYLNVVYFGDGSFGVDQAARRRFGKAVRDLTVQECAYLAASIRAPSASRAAKASRQEALLRAFTGRSVARSAGSDE